VLLQLWSFDPKIARTQLLGTYVALKMEELVPVPAENLKPVNNLRNPNSNEFGPTLSQRNFAL